MPEKKSGYWMIQASSHFALAVQGSEEDALREAKNYGRLNQFLNGDPLRFEITDQTPEALAILKRHPYYPYRSPLDFVISDEGNGLIPVLTGRAKIVAQSSAPEI